MKYVFETALLLALVFVPGLAVAGGEGLIVKPSAYSVKETLDRFEAVLKKKGITVFAQIDHAGGAKTVGLELLPTRVIIFGTPKMGTPLMAANRKIGIDLPLKALVWRDAGGKVWLAYNDPETLKSRYRIATRDKVFAKMAKALGGLTDAALK